MREPEVAILLAAGRGRRLRPATDTTPKPLLPVGYLGGGQHVVRPILDHILHALTHTSVKTVCLVTHYLEEQIHTFVGDGSRWQLTALFCHQSQMLGTAHAIHCVQQQFPHLLERATPLLICATDYILPPFYLQELVDFHTQHSAEISVSLKQLTVEQTTSRSSVRFDDEQQIIEIVEKPMRGTAPSTIGASLIYILPTSMTNYLPQVPLSARGEYELPSLVNAMVADGYVARGLIQLPPAEWSPPSL